MGRLLVTGGSGFIGSALCRALHARGHQVRILDNGSRGAARRLTGLLDELDVVEGDIRNAKAVSDATRGVDAVLHLAYVNGTEFFYRQPGLVLDVAIRGMMNVLDACKQHDVKTLLLMSSSEVYQTPPRVPTDESVPLIVPDVFNPRYSYGGGKILCELLSLHASEHLQRVVIVRPHNVYGQDMGWEHVVPQLIMRLARLAKRTPTGAPVELPIRGSGDQRRAFIHIDDFTRGVTLAFDKGLHRDLFHIGSMEELTVREVVQALAAEMRLDVTVRPGPTPAGETDRRCPDTGKIQALGLGPVRPFPQGVKDVVRWYLDHRDLWPSEDSDIAVDARRSER